MLDNISIKLIKAPLNIIAARLHPYGITANQVTFTGFLIGCLAFPALITEHYFIALFFILLNRICDGVDGALARIQGITDAGGFLDISLDFFILFLNTFRLCTRQSRAKCHCWRIFNLCLYWNGQQFSCFCCYGQ